jgi:hypothetical protein
LIEVQEVWSRNPQPPVCELLGHQVQFQTDYIAHQTASLPLEIGRFLLQIHRFATCRHWQLVVEKIERPFASWIAGEGAGASHRARQQKLDELERDFTQAHEAAVAQQLQAWLCSC